MFLVRHSKSFIHHEEYNIISRVRERWINFREGAFEFSFIFASKCFIQTAWTFFISFLLNKIIEPGKQMNKIELLIKTIIFNLVFLAFLLFFWNQAFPIFRTFYKNMHIWNYYAKLILTKAKFPISPKISNFRTFLPMLHKKVSIIIHNHFHFLHSRTTV